MEYVTHFRADQRQPRRMTQTRAAVPRTAQRAGRWLASRPCQVSPYPESDLAVCEALSGPQDHPRKVLQKCNTFSKLC